MQLWPISDYFEGWMPSMPVMTDPYSGKPLDQLTLLRWQERHRPDAGQLPLGPFRGLRQFQGAHPELGQVRSRVDVLHALLPRGLADRAGSHQLALTGRFTYPFRRWQVLYPEDHPLL